MITFNTPECGHCRHKYNLSLILQTPRQTPSPAPFRQKGCGRAWCRTPSSSSEPHASAQPLASHIASFTHGSQPAPPHLSGKRDAGGLTAEHSFALITVIRHCLTPSRFTPTPHSQPPHLPSKEDAEGLGAERPLPRQSCHCHHTSPQPCFTQASLTPNPA